jgi:hypothetical protein
VEQKRPGRGRCCEQDGGGSEGGEVEEVDESVIEAEGEEEGAGQELEVGCQERAWCGHCGLLFLFSIEI